MKQPPFLQLKNIFFCALVLIFSSNHLFAQTFVGASSTPATDGGTQAGPTVAVAPPPALPSGMQSGDLVIIYAHYFGTGVTFAMSQTSNQVWSTATSSGSGNQVYAIFWCRFNGTWGSNPSVTIGTGTNGMSVSMHVFRPTNSGKGWAINAGPTNTPTGNNATTAVTIAQVTTTMTNTVTMAFWGSPAASTWGTLTGTGWNKPGAPAPAQYRNTQAASNQSHSAAYKIMSAAGATGGITQTRSAGTMITQRSILSWAEVNVSDNCNSAISLTPGTTCVTILGSLNGATYTAGNGVPGCGAANLDVWYKFVAQSSNPVITTTKTSGSGLRRSELYEGTCGSLTSKACSGDNNSLNATGLIFGQTYYVRVYSDDANAYDFTICVQDQAAANGTCATVATLTPSTTCTTIAGDLFLANQTNPTNGCGDYWDVWYRFTTTTGYSFANITVTPTGSSSALTSANTFIEPFKTTNCGSLANNSAGCSNIGVSRTLNVADNSTYYFRVYTTANPNVYGSSYQFNICVTLSNEFKDRGSRMNEVFKQTILSPPNPSPNVLLDPWEITYGADDKLWITESKGYKVYRMDPATGVRTTVLDISDNSTFLGPDTANIRSRSNNGSGAQGGLAGLALHPNFMDGTVNEKNYVYISYVFVQTATVNYPPAGGNCRFFINKLVRFTYDPLTDRLGSPMAICDTLPGGNDHNSQRMIIAPVVKGGPKYLFYASGDLGGGQLDCRLRPQNAQNINSYEGKILRFNLEPEIGEPNNYQKWIPNDNPYFSGTSAVWSIGIRNNQGFAYDTAKNILYGSSHGPYSDDEVNVIEGHRNYGHPLVIGYASDGNYDGDTTIANQRFSAGSPYTASQGWGVSMCPPVGSEMGQKALIDANGNGLYKDPLFSAYPGPATGPGSVDSIWRNNPGNANPPPGWPSEGWSGLDLYSSSKIPGWKKSLVAASLKWGRLVRIKLGASGNITMPSNHPINNAGDSIAYFGSQNRFRDLAFDPNGRDIYVVMDRSTTTSGPSAQWPVVPACQGCVQKYTFLGYNVNTDNENRSYIPETITVAQGKNNDCDSVNAVTINDANDNTDIWVPLTDTSSNIVAEIYALGQDLGRVTARVYHNANAIRSKSGKKYLDRNITIIPENQPSSDVKIRLYITRAEYDALKNASGSAITNPEDLKIFKNNDGCSSAISANPTAVLMDFDNEAFGADGYVLQGTINSFSTFYFGSGSMSTLPLDLITFTGSLQRDNTVLLKWKTENEKNTSYFIVERSIDGNQFSGIGNVTAKSLNNSNTGFDYSHPDIDAANQQSLVLYYRLKMVDIDGSYKYSNVIAITLNSITGKMRVSPNPAEGIINVSIPSFVNEKAKWKLMDNTGRVLLQNAIELKTGNNNWKIDISGLTAGSYYLIISGATTDQKVKIQKL